METLPSYLHKLIQSLQHVDARGMSFVPQLQTLALEDLYIPLTAQVEEDPWQEDAAEQPRPPVDAAEEPESPADLIGRERNASQAETGLALELLWERGGQWMLLGAPGAGKTTALKYLALSAARTALDSGGGEWPLPVNLVKFAHALEAHPAWPADSAFFEYLRQARLPDLGISDADWLEATLLDLRAALANHAALILLDGLDTIPDDDLRRRVLEAIDGLLRRYPGNRCMVSSRLLGHHSPLLEQGFQVATLEPFAENQIRNFFSHWMYALEKQEDVLVDAATRRHAEDKANALLEQLQQRPQICAQVSNPLLCTLIGLVYKQTGAVPEHQAELYKLGVDNFILHWEVLKRRYGLAENSLGKDETLDMLETVALHIHEHCQRHRISSPELLHVIAAHARKTAGLSEEESRLRADQLVELLRLDAGLLILMGNDEYGFFHQAFQEYLAARAITRHPRILAQYLQNHGFKSQWRGVFRLAAAHQGMKGEEAGSEFIETLLRHPHPREEQMHYAFRFAFQCMRISRVQFETADRLFQRWITLYLGQPVLQPAFNRLLRYAGGLLRYKPRAIQPLLESIRHDDADTRGKAAEALGHLHDLKAMPELLEMFQHDPHPLARARAAEALGNLGAAQAMPALLEALRQDSAFFVRRYAALALGKLHEDRSLPVLLGALRDPDPAVRWRSAEALGNLKNPEAVPHLLNILRGDSVSGVRWRAAEALAGFKDPSTLEALLQAAKKDPIPTVRSRAAEALGHFPAGLVLPALLDALQNDNMPAVRWRAAAALGNLKEPLAVPALLKALQNDVDNAVRWSAAEALGHLRDAAAAEALRHTLRHDADPSVRWSAAEALGYLRDAAAVPVLLDALENDWYASVRGKACQALGWLRDASAVPALLQTLQNDKDPQVRGRAAEALGYIKIANAIPALLVALRDDPEASVRRRAADALANLRDASAVPALLEALQADADLSVRRQAAQSLELIDLGCLL